MSDIYQIGANGLWVFLVLTVVLGGAGGFVTGRAMASTWRPVWMLVLYMVLLAAAVRFFHYALFAEPLLAAGNFIIDFAVLLAAGLAGYRTMRARQMATRYGWLDGDGGPG